MKISESFRNLPVSEIADGVCASLAEHPRLVVTAPPGAGKSTLLPLALLEGTGQGKILMLEPRRIAARQVAERMAAMLGEEVGATVGYRMRFDSRTSASTRVVVITEGIMERILIEDPTLDGVTTVIFDEFHERSLSSDVSLTMIREIQDVLRPDLRILMMSATIDASRICRDMDARHLHSSGRSFDVDIVYCGDIEPADCALETARCVRKVLSAHDGNILAFLPGQAEILKCRDLLEDNQYDVEILTLYGMMPAESQHRVMRRPDGGRRMVVLASPIAETSLTIEGITAVVDSGLYRTPVFEPSTGLSRLVTSRISLDMARQRSGRAGRLAAGVCYRLWSKGTEARMKDSRQPEILSADLSSMMLELASWGETDPLRLPWITPPPEGHVAKARKLLQALGAIDAGGRLTAKGRRVANLPCHPRIASMLAEAGSLSSLACDVAAILEEKDPCHDETDADLTTRVALLRQYRRGRIPSAWRRIDSISSQYHRLVRTDRQNGPADPEDIGMLLTMAYPERIAMRDAGGHYRLASGGTMAALHPADDLARHDFLAVASMGTRVFLAAPVSGEWLKTLGEWTECASWNSREGRAVVREELRLGSLILESRQARGDIRGMVAAAVASAAPKEGLTMFDFNDEVQDMQLRIATMAEWHPELDFPDVGTERILALAGEWLPLYIGRATTVQELRKIDMASVIYGMLGYDRQTALDRLAPTQIKLPSGRNARIRYRRGAEAPVVSARLQDCFGMMKTPCVDDGKRPVLMELLSPGFKPVQLTRDMEGFWRETYFEVRKELRRRYPKHKWPENPLCIPGID
ncbi:MAG: ATP-dependent helicase HrpB [Bacteroides sp.]|nr:ATP-dependent helicase HrpB [Bacteroides sp.]